MFALVNVNVVAWQKFHIILFTFCENVATAVLSENDVLLPFIFIIIVSNCAGLLSNINDHYVVLFTKFPSKLKTSIFDFEFAVK